MYLVQEQYDRAMEAELYPPELGDQTSSRDRPVEANQQCPLSDQYLPRDLQSVQNIPKMDQNDQNGPPPHYRHYPVYGGQSGINQPEK
jgi:hypothetical protein